MAVVVQIIMQSKQQKQIESDGQFQQIRDQIETLNPSNLISTIRKKAVRKNINSEKVKLGILQSTSLSQSLYSPNTSKSIPQSYGKILKVGSATFRSNYECGHIGRVQLIGVNVFRIGLDEESSSTRGNIWFDFVVEGIKGEAKFIIEGFTKTTSLYNNGMKICCRDLKEDRWRRGGAHISYIKSDKEDEDQTSYELHFTYFFKNNQQSSIQFAYAFPYNLKRLQSFIKSIHSKAQLQLLGRTYEGRDIPLLSIGNQNSKELIVLSSRVHPGQTCSSFIIEGLLKELLSDSEHSRFLRQKFYFKVVPMINLDGVAKGNYRFSAAGVDLNRKWKQPMEQQTPEIYYLKEMILKESKVRKVKMFIDMHGHSRKKNVFFYGCSATNTEQDYIQSKAFPFLMSKLHSAFSYFDSNFNIQKEKEGTARISMWKQFKICQIFTLEASMCGSQVGSNYTEADYEKIGKRLCQGISIYFSPQMNSQDSLVKKLSKFKEEALKMLSSDLSLLKVGTFQNSGSESEPQKGENTKEDKPISKMKLSTLHKNTRKMLKNSSFKQKCQTTIPQQSFILVKQKESYEYLLDIPSHNTINDRKLRPPSMITNKRAYSLSRNNNYHTNIKPIFNEEEIYVGQDRSVDKNKAHLLVGWQGAQYRRVRKVAQQNWKRESSLGDFQLKGLRNNKLQIQKAISLIPKLPTNLQSKSKKVTAADMFFRKPQKIEERISVTQEQMNVLCRGKQILF